MADDRDRCKRAYERLRSMVQGVGPNDTARIAARCSTWANPTGVQWSEVNKIVDKDMVKSIWRGVPNDNISKGRLKLSQCSDNDIREHGERIFLDVMGQPMHHQDCPLWFAKMLYCHFVLQRPVDFSSRTPHLVVEDIRSSTITITREELGLALQGAACEVHDVKEELQTQLQASQAAPAGASSSTSRDLARELKVLQRQLQKMEEQLACKSFQSIEHPNTILPPPLHAVAGGPCPVCRAFFHDWSGHYVLPCGHMYHISCLMQSMMNSLTCAICNYELSEHLYNMFKLSSEYERLVAARDREAAETIGNLSL